MNFPLPKDSETREEYAERCKDIAEMYWEVLRKNPPLVEYANEF